MNRRHFILLAGAILVACLSGFPISGGIQVAAEAIPAHLSDREFEKLMDEFSEPDGSFRSDNLLSNEAGLQRVIPELVRTAKHGRVYMGVGPEQNFTYITALRPKMAFIVDVRRLNRDLHLMYKAVFELSADRAEFVSRLFSIQRPEGLTGKSTASEIFEAYSSVEKSEELYRQNLKAIRDQLLTKRKLALIAADLEGIEYVYHAFFWYGPTIQYSSTGSFGGRSQPTYYDLMVANDGTNDGKGEQRSYLSSEENFAFLKGLETKNMLVPIVGNFAGPKAIRSVGKYLVDKGAVVSAFYLSNVEQYLMQEGRWSDFCHNVSVLPLDDTSTFIRAVRGGRNGAGFGFGLSSEVGPMLNDVKNCGDGR